MCVLSAVFVLCFILSALLLLPLCEGTSRGDVVDDAGVKEEDDEDAESPP